MRTSWRAVVVFSLLLMRGFAQEPARALVSQVASADRNHEQTIATGSAEKASPVLDPKALPTLHPTLGEIARAARAAHSASLKAQLVLNDETPASSTESASPAETASASENTPSAQKSPR